MNKSGTLITSALLTFGIAAAAMAADMPKAAAPMAADAPAAAAPAWMKPRRDMVVFPEWSLTVISFRLPTMNMEQTFEQDMNVLH
jgi:hypothetical protein